MENRPNLCLSWIFMQFFKIMLWTCDISREQNGRRHKSKQKLKRTWAGHRMALPTTFQARLGIWEEWNARFPLYCFLGQCAVGSILIGYYVSGLFRFLGQDLLRSEVLLRSGMATHIFCGPNIGSRLLLWMLAWCPAHLAPSARPCNSRAGIRLLSC